MTQLGYDANFLSRAVEAPLTPDDEVPGAATWLLHYHHFSVRMHPTRKLAWWVAWHIDGLKLFPSESISRSGQKFKLDPRLDPEAQTGDEAYADNDLDRGHVARRSDLLWGDSIAEAKQANADSFYFTNITPQRSGFNQSGRGGVWGLLENAVLALDGLERRRLTLFGGPVLAEADPTYRDIVQLPREFWKVVVYRVDDEVRYKPFLLTQSLDGIEPALPQDFLDGFDTYLVSLEFLEKRTGLTFAGLHDHATPGLRPTSTPQLVSDVELVSW